ncbi:UNVERIFIED_CONTAM: B3 domain-containing protein [Sesamum radiatum]|uniref:B3 domain-containing protein n=1 Tax=Sesamum radiatum TaxID=300843 RepID=A0AAW2S0T7_SESRA
MGYRPAPNAGEGFEVNVRDVDTGSEHMLVLKLWKSTKSYVLTKNWMSEFVKRRELEEKDEIGLRWNDENSRLEFTLLRRKLVVKVSLFEIRLMLKVHMSDEC